MLRYINCWWRVVSMFEAPRHAVKFYWKLFWNALGNQVVYTLNHVWIVLDLSALYRRGVVTPLHRCGKDDEFIQIRRPTSVLNVDYKIQSKVLAQRMEGVIDTFITWDKIDIKEWVLVLYRTLHNWNKERNIPGVLFFWILKTHST